MRTETKTINIYQFNELSENAKENAINRLSNINIDHDWFYYDDAETVGCKIEGFNLDRAQIDFSLCESLENVCNLILKNHGEKCETYYLASKTLDSLKELQSKLEGAKSVENDDDIYDLENEIEELEKEFEKNLGEEYLSMLNREYDYLTSSEAIIETIEANEYEFLENGQLA